MNPVYRMRAEFCKAVASPKRLEILDLLRGGESNVTHLARAMDVPPANVSQELAPLRLAGMVQARRAGKAVYYRLANPKVLSACDLLAEAMRELTTARAASVRSEPHSPQAGDAASKPGPRRIAASFRE